MDGARMSKPKKFEQPKNVTFTLEEREHDALRLMAARERKSVSALIGDIVKSILRKKRPKTQLDSET